MSLVQLPFSTGGSAGVQGWELMLSDKDGKPKVHSIPDFPSQGVGGGTQCSSRLGVP